MSQIIGIICKDCILVACESQGTTNERKQFDANKMELVRFKDKWVLVALAGGMAAAGRVIHLMNIIAKDQTLENEWTLPNVASQAINQFKNEIMAMHQNATYSLQERHQLFSNYDFSLMLTDYSRNKPCLYTIDFCYGTPEKHQHFATMGAADSAIQFAISQLPETELGWELALVTVIDAIEQVKGMNIYCGGAIKGAIVQKHCTKPIFWPQEKIDRIVKLTKELRLQHREFWQRDALQLIERIRAEDIKRNEEEDKEEERLHSDPNKKGVIIYSEKQTKTTENKGENK